MQAEAKKKTKQKEEQEATEKEGISKATSANGAPATKKWKWEDSWAKEILRLAILNGDITDKHTLDEIHLWHPEVQATDRSKLSGRIRSLKDQVHTDKECAIQDDIDLTRDRKMFPIPSHNYRGEPRSEGSQAERILKEEIAKGEHLKEKPSIFASRQVFQDYPDDVIRDHIYQEIKFQKYCLYRKDKKNSKLLSFSS